MKNLVLNKTKFDKVKLNYFFVKNQFFKFVNYNNKFTLITTIKNMFELFQISKNFLFLLNKDTFGGNYSLKLFLKYLSFLLKGIHQMFFIELKIVGLGYKIYKYKKFWDSKIICFKLGYSHLLKYVLPKNIHLVTGKRRILIYTNDYNTLMLIYQHLFFLKKVNPYKTKGIIDVNKQHVLKQGKQQQR